MRTLRFVFLALASVLMVACGADVGEHGTRLVVDESRVTSELLYMLPDISEVPFTAGELQDQGIDANEAIPVRVEVFETTAVAWFAPDGEARIGSDWIIALWSVERVPVSNETARGEIGTVRDPGRVVDTSDVTVDVRPNYDVQLTDLPEHAGAIAIIDFLDRLGTPAELEFFEEIITHHPGCLQE